MFSTSGMTPQVGGALAGLGSALSNAKNSAIARCMTYVQKKTWKVNQKQESEKAVLPESTSSTEQLYSRLVDEFGLAYLPTDWQTCLGLPLTIKPQNLQGHNPWTVSHVSSESFFENKHGLTQVRTIHSAMSMKRIDMLEERANSEQDNPKAQADYLRAMVAEDPSYVIRRYESGRYASDESVRREYLKALVLADRVNYADLDKLNSYSSGLGAPKEPSYSPNKLDNGTEDKPVHVVLQSQKGAFFKEQLWNTIRFLIGLFLILSVIEAQLQMKMTTNQKEIQPDNVDRKFRFQDVQGVDEAKEELQEVVEFLRNPEKFKKLGGKLPTGVLLIGSPGTGKTLLAKAVAGEAGVPFFFCSGSEFDEMFVGVGAARVRNLFAAAREHAPCIVFVDELDAIGGSRVVHDHQPYSRMTLNQLLVELDGFEKSEGIVVIGATNFPEVLDKALIRPGRFDTKIDVPMPDIRARVNILKVHLKNVTVSDEVDVEVLGRGTTGFSGADLANLVNQAAVKAATEGDTAVNNKHLEFAKDKIIMGPERKSAVISDENRKMVAYHEGGHALVAYFTDAATPLHKATIMPRGQALGMVTQLPEKDELQHSKKQLLAKLDVFMAGRVAEEIIFGMDNITTGASHDFEVATKIARQMVTKFGMSEKAGFLLIREDDNLSPETKSLIENEVKRLLTEAYDRAKHILHSRAKEHKRLAEALLKYETLNAEEINQVVQGKTLTRNM